ncbi:MAG: hypothetical protein A2542_01155 [Parcubacteria group bacterium RIFOXYD2_FULL_52_8]|nr:MAG: hypothetical protein A2542_01155 [Parcubacteria group bacterium RIFOXYD2_FULL_52_8]
MAKQLIVANWKMHPDSLQEAKTLFAGVKKTVVKLKKVKAVVCPPAIFLHAFTTAHPRLPTAFSLGAQDCFYEKRGAHTGELSAAILADARARYVILGHSERRQAGETSAQVARKINLALDAGLTPIVCIGEKVRDEHGFYLKYIEEQLAESLLGVSRKRVAMLVFAYEPVWAVSDQMARAATPEESNEMVLYLRKLLSGKIGIAAAKAIPILYGGSVDARNCESFLQHGGVQGLLVGHASHDGKQFAQMLQIAERCA